MTEDRGLRTCRNWFVVVEDGIEAGSWKYERFNRARRPERTFPEHCLPMLFRKRSAWNDTRTDDRMKGDKRGKFVNFFGLFWLVVRAILLDIETGDASDLLGWPICCVRDKVGSAIWWFGL